MNELGRLYQISKFELDDGGHAGLIFEDGIKVEIHLQHDFVSLYSLAAEIPEGADETEFMISKLEQNLLGFASPHLCWSKLKNRRSLFLRRDFDSEELVSKGLEKLLIQFYQAVKKEKYRSDNAITDKAVTSTPDVVAPMHQQDFIRI
ncbi:type III secretion system chaperone [Pleionea sp. CnH1-48]|uniref:type III secretion system chaperone n=1 Tax=Pleionea sp. CnH1-48 TaxID=2954494 RepID=UPI00209851A8|nr:type III secretion system chaperone [Pleionea sp. CnH1-48]MCO7226904.1 type III secretion system chaperone [Pleionea sp. CnH1-48]